MTGAIAGDFIGSVYEFKPHRSKIFPLFHRDCTWTDDTVLTAAVAHRVLVGGSYVDHFHDFFAEYPRAGYPNAGYGGSFLTWASSRDPEPYNSWGNGSAMRVSPVGIAFETYDEVLEQARASAVVTHDHPEGVRGAQAVAGAVFLARTGTDRDVIRERLEHDFGYDLSTPLDAIRDSYQFNESCQGSVPQSIRAFLESTDYEDAVRNAVSLGGDADTMACIAGSIAEAAYGGVPPEIARPVLATLDSRLRDIVDRFYGRYADRLTGAAR